MNEGELEVGLDEAGRGPMFGRVYVAAVIIPQDDSYEHSLMRDSKKLSENKRLYAFDYIKENAIDWVVKYKDEKYIDKHNIFKANYDAMHEAIDKLLVTLCRPHILSLMELSTAFASSRVVTPDQIDLVTPVLVFSDT